MASYKSRNFHQIFFNTCHRWGSKQPEYIFEGFQNLLNIIMTGNKMMLIDKERFYKILKDMLDYYYMKQKRNEALLEFHRFKYFMITEVMVLGIAIAENINSTLMVQKMKELLYSSQEDLHLIESFVQSIYKNDLISATKIAQMEEFVSLQIIVDYIKEKDNEVVLVGMMSAGKSTFMNAMIGKTLLPEKLEACTAKLMTLTHQKNEKDVIAFVPEDFYQIQQAVVQDDLIWWNKQKEINDIYIAMHMEGFKNSNQCMTFIDTPGPNNARNEIHELITQQLLKQSRFGYLLYVMNATNLSTEDDKHFLKEVISHAKGKSLTNKIIFIVNKVDEIDIDAGESVAGMINNIRTYIKKLGIEQPTIIPTSAYAAKLFRMQSQKDKLTRKETRDFNWFLQLFTDADYNLNNYAVGINKLNRNEKSNIAMYEKKDKLAKALHYTGIELIEALLIKNH